MQDVKFFKDMSDVQGRGEGFPKFEQCRTRGNGGLKIDVFVGRLLWMAP